MPRSRLWDIDLEGPVEKSLHDLQASNGTVLTVFADCDEPGHTLTVDLVLEHVYVSFWLRLISDIFLRTDMISTGTQWKVISTNWWGTESCLRDL